MFTSIVASGRTRAIRLAGSAAIITILATGAGAIVTPAHAAVPAASPVPGLRSALVRATNYQLDLSVSTGGGTASATKGTIVAVRKGGTFQLYLHLTVTAAGQTQTVIATVAGSKVCIRVSAGGTYQCQTNASLARQLASVNSVSNFNSATTFTPLAQTKSVTINGSPQACSAYALASSTRGARTQGTIYVLPATGQPCEFDATTRVTVSGQSVTATTTAVWSRFNDPSLTIPSI